MHLEITEPLGNTEIAIAGFTDIYDLLSEIITCSANHVNTRCQLSIPLDLFITFEGNRYHVIKFGIISEEAEKVMNKIKRLSKTKRKIANINSISIDEFEREMYIIF